MSHRGVHTDGTMLLNGTPQWAISLEDSWCTSSSGATGYLSVRTWPNRRFKTWRTKWVVLDWH